MSIAVLGTNTEVGKTFISAALAYAFRERGIEAVVFKPVETGEPDSELLKKMGVGVNSVYRFKTPATPMLAAELEGEKIDIEHLIEECRNVLKSHEYVIVEGVGGVASPIWKNFDSSDLVASLGIRSLLVSLNTLGSLTSVITSAKYLEMKGVELSAVILNRSDDSFICKTNTEILKEFLRRELFSLEDTTLDEAKQKLLELVDVIK